MHLSSPSSTFTIFDKETHCWKPESAPTIFNFRYEVENFKLNQSHCKNTLRNYDTGQSHGFVITCIGFRNSNWPNTSQKLECSNKLRNWPFDLNITWNADRNSNWPSYCNNKNEFKKLYNWSTIQNYYLVPLHVENENAVTNYETGHSTYYHVKCSSKFKLTNHIAIIRMHLRTYKIGQPHNLIILCTAFRNSITLQCSNNLWNCFI